MTHDQRSIRLEVEVAGTPDEVWRAIATGPGVSSWYVPHTAEVREGGTCLVRLVNSGFGSGADADASYGGMSDGWKLFLRNRQLHLEHFRGQSATAMVQTAMWDGTRRAAWVALAGALGIPAAPTIGERVVVSASDAPALSGTVVDATEWRLALWLTEHSLSPG